MARPRTPKGRARETVARLAEEYPGDERDLCALVHDNPFQLLAATILLVATNAGLIGLSRLSGRRRSRSLNGPFSRRAPGR